MVTYPLPTMEESLARLTAATSKICAYLDNIELQALKYLDWKHGRV